MLGSIYYAQNYASIMWTALARVCRGLATPLNKQSSIWDTANLTKHLPYVQAPVLGKRWYSQGDYEKACELLDRVDWDQLMDEPDVDQCWQSWQSTYLNIISKCIPKKVLSSRRNLPWINPTICQAIKRRNSLFKAYKRSGSSFKLLQYKFIRNRIVSEVRKAKLKFFKRLQAVDAKTFWKLFKLLTRKESCIPALLGPNSTLVTNDVQKADILNNQFFQQLQPYCAQFNFQRYM